MPDILIRWIEMPQSCFECALFSNCDSCEGYECYCGAIGAIGYIESVPKDSRRDDCPLIELPPHGDLIDRDALNFFIESGECNSVGKALQQIDKAPVVVPAERREV